MRRLAVLGSTRGTVMLALIDAIKKKQLAASIEIVISNKSNALILESARQNAISAEFIDPNEMSRDDYDQKITALLHKHSIDLIVLIGYMRILSNAFINEWRNRIINIHPSLLPDFAGGMDKNVHQAVLNAGIKETGCTVHYVTEQVDAGPILLQKKCPVLSTDTVESLKNRVQELEAKALIEVINAI